MNDIERNAKCPCGSGKKYKSCYSAQNSICVLKIKEHEKQLLKEHDSKEKEVFSVLNEIVGELNQLFFKPEGQGERIPLRMQMIGIFTVIDVFANYFDEYEYNGSTGSSEIRVKRYIDKFILTEDNVEYKNRIYLKRMDSEKLYKLRCGLIHFYGIATEGVVIVPNNPNVMTKDKFDEIDQKFKNKGRYLTFVQPWELKKIVINSALEMLEFMKAKALYPDATDKDKMQHVKRIDRIAEKLKREGAKNVPLYPDMPGEETPKSS